MRIKESKPGDGCFSVRCRLERDLTKLLNWDGAHLGTRSLHIVRAEIRIDIQDAFSYLKRKLTCFEDAKQYDPDHPQIFSIFSNQTGLDHPSPKGSTSSQASIRLTQTRGHGRGKGGWTAPAECFHSHQTNHHSISGHVVGSTPTGFSTGSSANPSKGPLAPNLPSPAAQRQGKGERAPAPISNPNHSPFVNHLVQVQPSGPAISQPKSKARNPKIAEAFNLPTPHGRGRGRGSRGPAPVSNSVPFANHLVQVPSQHMVPQLTSPTQGIPPYFVAEPCAVCLTLGQDAHHEWRTCTVSQNLSKAFMRVNVA